MRLLTAMMGTRDALKAYPSLRLPVKLRVPAILFCKNSGPCLYICVKPMIGISGLLRLCYTNGDVFHPRCVYTCRSL